VFLAHEKIKGKISKENRSRDVTPLFVVDLLKILEMNPYASLDLSQGTQKPDTIASHCAPHPAACHQPIITQ
jgi:hypothetical protein